MRGEIRVMKSLQACGAMARGKLMESVSVSLLEQILKMSTCEKAGMGWGGGMTNAAEAETTVLRIKYTRSW